LESVGGNEAVGRLLSNLKPFDATLKRIGSELVGSALKTVGNALMIGIFRSKYSERTDIGDVEKDKNYLKKKVSYLYQIDKEIWNREI
jgi:hypothetical protein